MNEETLEQELNGEFISPSKQFQGSSLAKYTEGSRLLLMQIREDLDSAAYFVWAFIYIHIELEKNRKDIIKLCWNKDEFRGKLFDWISSKTEEDREIATILVGKILTEADSARVSVVSQGTEKPMGNE